MLVDKIIIERHPSKIDKDGKRHYTIRAIPHQDPQQERLKAVHEARSRSSPGLSSRSITDANPKFLRRHGSGPG